MFQMLLRNLLCSPYPPLPLQALLRNQSMHMRQPEELVDILRSESPTLRALFAAHADKTTGKVRGGLNMAVAQRESGTEGAIFSACGQYNREGEGMMRLVRAVLLYIPAAGPGLCSGAHQELHYWSREAMFSTGSSIHPSA